MSARMPQTGRAGEDTIPTRPRRVDGYSRWTSGRGRGAHSAAPKNLEYLGLPNPREWQPCDEDWKLPENWKEIILEGLQERLEKYRSFRLFMDICVRCGACADKCHFFIGIGRPQEHAGPAGRAPALGLPEVLHRCREDPGQAGGGPGPHRRRAQGVVLLFLPVHRMPPLLGLLPLRHRPGGDHHDGAGAAQPRGLQHQLGHRACGQLLPDRQSPGHSAPRHSRTSLEFFADDIEEITGVRVERPDQQERGGDSFCHALRRLLRRPRHLHLHGVPDALPRDRPGLHLEHLCLGGGKLRPLHLPRDDQAAERQDLRRSEAAGGQMDPGRRVRPHVAGHPPVHGHHERPGGFPGGTGLPDHRHQVRERQVHQDGAYRGVHRRPDPEQKIETGPEQKRPPEGHLPRFLQPGPGDGTLRGAPVHPAESVQPFLRDAGKYHPGADLLLRRRGRPGHRRKHGDEDAGRTARGPTP